MNLLSIAIGAILVENYILVRFLGICPFLGVSKKMETAAGMGFAVIFVMTISSIMTWLCYNLILLPLELEFLTTIAFILIIASLVQFVEIVLKRFLPALYSSLGIYLPLITTNCAVLGAALINVERGYGPVESIVFGASAGIGFLLAIVLFSGLRERMVYCDIPRSLQGIPITLITAGLFALAFMGFSGLKVF